MKELEGIAQYKLLKDIKKLSNVQTNLFNIESEKFGLTNQIRRSAVSIPSNIAEGASRKSEKDFTRFLEYSLGSAFELETQLRIAQRRNFISQSNTEIILNNLVSLQKRISGLRKSIIKN